MLASGPRTGRMKISAGRVDGVLVVHDYGAGGSGFDFSYAVGERIAELVKQSRLKLQVESKDCILSKRKRYATAFLLLCVSLTVPLAT